MDNVEFNSINIWEAKGDSEFIITTKCFGVYEGTIGNVNHYFYVISPKRIIVLTNNINLLLNKSDDYIGMFPKHIHKNHIILYKNHKIINNLKSFPNPLTEKNIKPYFEEDDIFKMKINIVDESIVYLINSIFLEEENEGITFVSDENLYKTIIFYENCKELVLKRNYNNLKYKLKKTFNNSEENFNENIPFPYDEYIDKKDLDKLFKYNNSYFLKILVEQSENLNNLEKKSILEDGTPPIDFLPNKIQLKEGIVLKCKEMVEIYLSQMSKIRNIYTEYDIELINKELLNIPFVDIILKHNIDNKNETIIKLKDILKKDNSNNKKKIQILDFKNKESENNIIDLLQAVNRNDFNKIIEYSKNKNILKDESNIEEYISLCNIMLDLAINQSEKIQCISMIMSLVKISLFQDNENINYYNNYEKENLINFLKIPFVLEVINNINEIDKIYNLLKYIKN